MSWEAIIPDLLDPLKTELRLEDVRNGVGWDGIRINNS